GVPYMGAYAATKFAQVGLAESLRAEVAGSHIRVSVVYPVSTDTEFFDVMSHETGVAVTRAGGPRQPVEAVAHAVARASARPTPEVYPYFKSRLLVVLNAVAPGVADRLVQRFGRKPIRERRPTSTRPAARRPATSASRRPRARRPAARPAGRPSAARRRAPS